MNHILNIVFLGLIAGMAACFWTRIIKTNMIFGFLGRWLIKRNNRHVILTTKNSKVIKLITCSYCIAVWIMALLSVFYVLMFRPGWIFASVGVLGGLGSGNLIAEIVCSIRNGS